MPSAQYHGDYVMAGTPVRLSFDQGPASVGYVREVIDKVRVQVEFPCDDASHDGEFIDGPATVFVAPRSILVTVCEWTETYADEWGMACSEPGVPTSYSVPCLFDATTTVYPGGAPVNLCPEHATQSLRDALRESVR